jgi:signal transduction histidine kinase
VFFLSEDCVHPYERRATSLFGLYSLRVLAEGRLVTDARLRRERALREVTQALAEHLDEGRVLDLTVEHATSLLSAPYARVWLVDGEAGFRCAAAYGFVHPQTTQRHLPLDSVSGVAARGELLNLLDAPSHAAWRVSRDFGERTGMRAYLGAAIRRAGESLGVLEVMRERERRFGSADEQLLRTLADIVAVAVSNARQAARLRTAQQQLRMLADASAALAASFNYQSTLRQVCHLAVPTLADWCAISVLNDSGAVRRLASTPVPSTVSPAETIVEVATTVRTGLSSLDETRTRLVVPLIARGRTLGALSLVRAATRSFADEDLSLAEDLARRCATAVDNARLYEQAQDALQVRDQFLAVAAHELRSPLARLKSHTEVLADVVANGNAPVTQLIQSLHRMNAAIDRLSALTTDLLDVSRLRRRLPLRHQSVELGDLIRTVAADHQLHAAQRHRLLVELPAEPCYALADPDRLAQVVTNLLDNAVKYSPAGGTIEISVQPADTGTLVRVRDEGIGLPAGSAERVFEPFNRAANAFAGNIPGLGLGLHISRQIVQRHGGRMWAESPGEGLGTTVYVWLPKPRAARRIKRAGATAS